MKSLIKIVSLSLFLLSSFSGFSQQLTNRLFGSGNADVVGYLEHLPDDYATTTGRYPVIIFFHGSGENGNGTTDLAKISSPGKGLASLINSGGFPTSFTVGGKVYKFIVICPQNKNVSWIEPDVAFAVQQTLAIYKDRIDMQRVYMTGLSAGGGGVWAYLGQNGLAASIAATVICAGAHPAVGSFADNMVKGGVPIWAFHNQFDPTVPLSYTTDWFSMLTSKGIKPPMLETIYPGIAQHDCWTETYDPTSTAHANIYDWMLGYSRPGIPNPGGSSNQPPVANPGSSQTITLPSGATLNGSASSDPDGTIAAYAWTKVSGPAGDVIKTPSSASSAITFTTAGSYTYKLTVTDNGGLATSAQVTITVNAAQPANIPPVANAGLAQTITLPSGANLSGSASNDPDGTVAAYAWTKISGPAGDAITAPSTVSSAISFTTAGTYVYQLKVTDNGGLTNTAQVTITVKAANQPPVASAGTAQTITLPANAYLIGTASNDPDGSIATYAWTKVSGPSGDVITTPSQVSSAVSFTAAGFYVYKLTVTDNGGLSASAQVNITVNPAPSANKPPVSNPGAAQTITMPSTATLNGSSSSDPDGNLVSWYWTKISGPDGDDVKVPNAATTSVSFTTAGTYVYSLAVTDNSGATVSAQVTLTVNPANKLPVANAGANQAITLPVNTATLNGTLSADPDGSIASYKWSLVSSPSGYAYAGSTSPKPIVTGLNAAGSYIFSLIVTDNKGAASASSSQVTITVSAEKNQAPYASAGSNQTIILPSGATLNGSASNDADGSIASYAWSKIQGPIGDNIATKNQAVTTVSFSAPGVYKYSLVVTDNLGAINSSQVQITVNADTAIGANKFPVVEVNGNQTIHLSDAVATLDGSQSYDPDGKIANSSWAKISGPANDEIVHTDSLKTMVAFSSVGTYVYELTVTDNSGANSSEDLTITVLPDPSSSSADKIYARINTTIPSTNQVLATDALSFDASGSSDSLGSALSYSWSVLSGPAATIASPADSKTIVSGFSAGNYVIQLKITNQSGDTTTQTVSFTVSNSPLTADNSSYSVYPNPVQTVVNIQMTSATMATFNVLVFDINGRMVKKTQIQKSETYSVEQVDLSSLEKGIYILQLTAPGISKSFKIVKY